jgi:hypothetical protein
VDSILVESRRTAPAVLEVRMACCGSGKAGMAKAKTATKKTAKKATKK